jgi:hypothetical protein
MFRNLSVYCLALGNCVIESLFLLEEGFLLASDVLFVGQDKGVVFEEVEFLFGDAFYDFVIFGRETN